jgi:hypothetical protein
MLGKPGLPALRALLARRWLALAFGACLLAVLLPLAQTRVLPFHDASGIVGLGGALAHRDDAAANVRAFYDIDIGAYPSALYFGWAALAGKLGVSVEVAFNLFIALFAVAGPPLAMLLLLRAFGRPPHLALLVFPASYHHQIWFGFLGSAAAITGLVLALAFAKRLADRPRAADHLGLAGALLFVALAHPFPLALTLAVVAPVLVWNLWREPRWPRRAGLLGLRLLCFSPALLFLRGWSGSFFAGNAGKVPVLTRMRHELRLQLPHPLADARMFLEWLCNGYAAAWDELVPAVALLCLAAFLALGARAPGPAPLPAPAPPPARQRDLGWIWLAWAALVLGLGYLLLPMKLLWPNPWWGVRIRCVMPLYLVLIALVRPRPRGLPAWALAPAVAAALLFAGYVTHDLRAHFRGRVLDGFDEALAAIPPGRSVLAFTALPDPHYTRGHPYLVQHYVARRGGRAVPYLGGHPGSYWITLKPPPPSPPWGDPRAFDWNEHAAGYDYFLLELPTEGAPPDPMAGAPRDAVGEVFARGHWVVYRRLQ